MAKNPCIDVIRRASGDKITEQQAKELIDEIMAQAKQKEANGLVNVEENLRAVGKELIEENKLNGVLQKRNALLMVKASRRITEYMSRFPNMGEGLDAFMNGSRKLIKGARNSVHAQTIALRNRYIGELVANLENTDLMTTFKSGDLDQQIFTELWHFDDPNVTNPTGSKEALKIATIIKKIHHEMIPRENRAGAFIKMNENYVMTQTHDRHKIRKAGGMGYAEGSAEASFRAWAEFVWPLLDHEKTFKGVTGGRKGKMQFLKGVHEGILTGVHGKAGVPGTAEFRATGALAKKVSQARVLHFADAEGAFNYNQMFGIKNLREAIVTDMTRAAHNTALMENFGPNAEMTFSRILRQSKEAARSMPDDIKQLKTLESEWLQGSFDQLAGTRHEPSNPTLASITRGILAHSTLSRLGGVTLSAIPDKAFFQLAGTYQGMRGMDVFMEQFKLFVPKSAAEKSRLRMMGAAIDGFLGDVSTRFAANDNTAGRMYRLQQHLFKINGMNWWNDIHKGAFAKLEAAHLGEWSGAAFDALPDDLSKVLNQYGITGKEWDAIRKTVYTAEDGQAYITPDQLSKVSVEDIDAMIKESGGKVSDNNRLRMRDEMETKLRSFIVDQVDDAVVTPGNKERLIATLNTKEGTVKGSAARMLMHFKSFPISVFERVVKRELYGHGNFRGIDRVFNKANFRMLQLIGMTAIGGYLSLSVKDVLKGRTPRRLLTEDGAPDWKTLTLALQRGGGLGIYGDLLLTEYDRSYRNALNILAGPVIGQVPEIAAIGTDMRQGKNVSKSIEKLGLNNTPYINLFYIRPVLDYIILWNIQEMMNPGSLRKMERSVEDKNNQGFFIRPSEVVNR